MKKEPETFQNLTVEQANAKLIAAAPDMLEALKKGLKILQDQRKVLESWAPIWQMTDTIESMKAAISKAEGEQ